MRLAALLARQSDRAVFAACLAGLVAGIGLFLVLPLAPEFLRLHRLPTTRDFDVEVRPQGQVTAFWVVSMASFALAIWQWRRGRRPSWGLLLAGIALLHLLALLVPPVASKDVCLRVLGEAGGETLHWTVVLDRALTQRLIDPFTTPDVRGVVVKSLAALAKEGRVDKQGTGLYRAKAG